MTKRSMRLDGEAQNKKLENSFSLGITHPGVGGGRRAREGSKKKSEISSRGNDIWRQTGETDVRIDISRRKKCVLS